MTASEHSATDRALDVFVYLPAGVVVTALEEIPGAALKGRTRIEQRVRNAQFIGRLAVDFGWRELKSRVDSITRASGLPRFEGEKGSPRRDVDDEHRDVAGTITPSRARAPRTTRRDSPQVDTMIPDYDGLSASQVVRRLGGLSAGELRTVVRHERSTRARKSVLQRAEQLLESDRSRDDHSSGRQPLP